MAQGPFVISETGRFGAPVAQQTAILAQMAGEIKWTVSARASYGVSRTDRMTVVEWHLDRTLRNVDDSG